MSPGHVLLGEKKTRSVQKQAFQVILLRPRATWNKVGLSQCWIGRCSSLKIVKHRLPFLLVCLLWLLCCCGGSTVDYLGEDEQCLCGSSTAFLHPPTSVRSLPLVQYNTFGISTLHRTNRVTTQVQQKHVRDPAWTRPRRGQVHIPVLIRASEMCCLGCFSVRGLCALTLRVDSVRRLGVLTLCVLILCVVCV